MLKPEVVVWTLPSEAVTTPTRGTVVIADWEALPVAEALSPEAEPPAPVEMALRAGFRIVRAAEGEAVAPEEREDSTPGSKSVRDAWVGNRERNVPWHWLKA